MLKIRIRKMKFLCFKVGSKITVRTQKRQKKIKAMRERERKRERMIYFLIPE